MQFDFSIHALNQVEATPSLTHSLDLFVANALVMPLRSGLFDLIIEKGLFDSVTGRADIAVERASELVSEYHRCLRVGGQVVMFSLYSPSSEDKDMLGLLRHSCMSVECRDLFISPVEIPSQDFCFAYIITKTEE
jgi:hypothetical protein